MIAVGNWTTQPTTCYNESEHLTGTQTYSEYLNKILNISFDC